MYLLRLSGPCGVGGWRGIKGALSVAQSSTSSWSYGKAHNHATHEWHLWIKARSKRAAHKTVPRVQPLSRRGWVVRCPSVLLGPCWRHWGIYSRGVMFMLRLALISPWKGRNFFRYFAGKGSKFRENFAKISKISLKFRNFVEIYYDFAEISTKFRNFVEIYYDFAEISTKFRYFVEIYYDFAEISTKFRRNFSCALVVRKISLKFR